MIVATKSDKLSNNQKVASMRIFEKSFGAQSVIMSSAETGEGYKEIWKRVMLAAAVKE